MKYTCEYCEKIYNSEKEALQCEAKHKEDELKKQKDEREKTERSDAISNLINLYIQRYKETPEVKLSEENMKVLYGEICSSLNIEKLLKALM